MAISITATPNTAGYVALAITGAGAASLVSLTRADANGTRVVRTYPDQDFSAGELYVNDAEAALTGSIVYTVVTDLPETSSVSTSFTEASGPYLSQVLTPSDVVAVSAVLEYESNRRTNSTVHYIINRADPIVSIGTLSTRTGQMEIFCNSYSQVHLAENLLSSGEILMLRQSDHAGMDMYFVAIQTTASVLAHETTPQKWVIGVQFQEVVWPNGYLRGTAGWTIADALARNATILEELTEFETISEAVVGP